MSPRQYTVRVIDGAGRDYDGDDDNNGDDSGDDGVDDDSDGDGDDVGDDGDCYGDYHVVQNRNKKNTYCSPRIYVGESILSSLGSLVKMSRTE
jgi:hypothetical protein